MVGWWFQIGFPLWIRLLLCLYVWLWLLINHGIAFENSLANWAGNSTKLHICAHRKGGVSFVVLLMFSVTDCVCSVSLSALGSASCRKCIRSGWPNNPPEKQMPRGHNSCACSLCMCTRVCTLPCNCVFDAPVIPTYIRLLLACTRSHTTKRFLWRLAHILRPKGRPRASSSA